MNVLYGVVTWYAIATFGGGPLYCGEGCYETGRSPWIALPVETRGTWWECGDEIVIWSGGEMHILRALDAGPFGRHCVEWNDECLAILGDVPGPWRWWPGLSTRAVVANRSVAKRRLEVER